MVGYFHLLTTTKNNSDSRGLVFYKSFEIGISHINNILSKNYIKYFAVNSALQPRFNF